MTAFDSRAAIGLAPARSSPRIPGPVTSTTGHYNGPPLGLLGSNHDRCRAKWREIQRGHMAKGWVDIAYNLGVCHHDVILAGRGKGVRSAANGTNQGNDTSYAIMALIGGDEKPPTPMLRAFKSAAALLGPTRLLSHSDHKPTECCGDPLRNWIRGGTHVGPDTPSEEDEVALKRGDTGSAVALMMHCLVEEAKASGRGGPAGGGMPDSRKADGSFDGIYGDEMVEAVTNYQSAAFKKNPRLVTGEVDGLTLGLLLRYE